MNHPVMLTWFTSSLTGLFVFYGLFQYHAPAWLWAATFTWCITTAVWATLRAEADNHNNKAQDGDGRQ